jgi:hypothetical protein
MQRPETSEPFPDLPAKSAESKRSPAIRVAPMFPFGQNFGKSARLLAAVLETIVIT